MTRSSFFSGVHRARAALRRVLLGGLLCAAASNAGAGIQSPCHEPIVLPGPRVLVFILPYQAEGALSAQGRELVTIVQRHVLFAALKYRSIAVAELTGDAKECGYERTAQQVGRKLQDGQTAIFLSGRLFEQGEAIRLQSTVAFLQRGRLDRIEWRLSGSEGGRTSATVPNDPVLFAPRQIPLYFLQMLQPAQRAARRLHGAADANSSFVDLPADPDARFGYEVLEVRPGWMYVRLFPAGGEGWISAHALTSADSLKGAFPELYFVDGLIGYHQLWAAQGQDRRRVLELARASFDRYIEQASGRAESEVRALATMLKGNATLRAAQDASWSTETLQQAQGYYRDAWQLAPTSTVAANFFLACSSALCVRGACSGGPNELHRQYLSAIAQDPTSKELIANLNQFYGAAQDGRIKIDVPPGQLAIQKAIAQRIERQMQ